MTPPNPNIKVEKPFHPRPHLKARRICFLHKPKLRSWKYSVVHKNQTSEVGCPPKNRFQCFVLETSNFNEENELSVQNTLFKVQPICCRCKAQVSKFNVCFRTSPNYKVRTICVLPQIQMSMMKIRRSLLESQILKLELCASTQKRNLELATCVFSPSTTCENGHTDKPN